MQRKPTMRQLIYCIGIYMLTASAGFAETYIYQEKDGTRWITDHKIHKKEFTFIDKYGRPTATKSCKGVTSSIMERRAQRYKDIIYRHADTYKVNPELIKAIITVESCFDHQAISRAGARGLMQLMPALARQYGTLDRFNPEDNIRTGTQHFSELLDYFKHNLKLSLAAYNAGMGAVKKYGGIPPYKETRNYVKKVIRYYKKYQKTDPAAIAIHNSP